MHDSWGFIGIAVGCCFSGSIFASPFALSRFFLILCTFGINEWTSKKTNPYIQFFFFRTPAICQFGWSSQIWNSVKQCETCIRSFVECIIQCCQSAVEGYDMMLIRSTATMNNYLGQKIKIVRTACSCAFYLNMQCSCWAEWCHETSTGHGKCAMASVPNIHRGAGWIHRLLRLLS